MLHIPIEIRDALRTNNVIFFVGSGFSQRIGFPNWRELIQRIIKKLEPEDPKYYQGLYATLNYFSEIEVLEKLKERKKLIYSVLEDNFEIKDEQANKLDLHKLLLDISPKIITTNYDKAFENSFPNLRKIDNDDILHLADMNKFDSYLFKLHGCINNPAKCILFKDSYDELYGSNHPAIMRLKNLIVENTIIFVGFSMSDPYVRYQFEHINDIFKGLSSKHFMISVNENNLEETNVETIKLESWDSLPELLFTMKEIKNATNQTATSLLNTQELTIEKHNEKKVKMVFLIAKPLDRENNLNFETYIRHFLKYNIDIDCISLTVENMQNLEGYDYIFIISSILNKKIVIEDKYLKTKLVTMKYIEENIGQNDIKALFIFLDKDLSIENKDATFPMVIPDTARIDLSGFVFQSFKKGEVKRLNNCKIINQEKLILTVLPKGNAKVTKVDDKIKQLFPIQIDPKKLNVFVGRTTDILDITRKVVDSGNNVLTIKGSGGIGKTTTVMKVAYELFIRNYFTEGVHFIDCEFISDYETFERKMAFCFDLEMSIDFKNYIVSNDIHPDKLLILDNFEPLLSNKDSEKIKDLVSFICDYSKLIITSREWLGLEFEERHELRSFTSDEAYTLFTKNYQHQLHDIDEKFLKEQVLDELLNNNPLAIKLITKHLPKNFSEKSLYEELSKDFFEATSAEYIDIFNNESDRNIERSKSLYHSINYSYCRLNNKEKLTFELLSLFPDGIHMDSFKRFFDNEKQRLDNNKITNREITSLEHKSLVDIKGGFIKLQSIIGRFADFQLSIRSTQEITEYYRNAYQYKSFFINFIQSADDEYRAASLQLFDQNSANFLKSVTYMDKFDSNKEKKLQYLMHLDYLFTCIEQTKMFRKKLNDLKPYFVDVEDSDLLMNISYYSMQYYEGEFGTAFNSIKKLLPFEKIKEINYERELNREIIKRALSIYEMEGYEYEIIELFLQDEEYIKYFDATKILFKLGEYVNCIGLRGINTPSFFDYEFDYNLGSINWAELRTHIEKLFKKEYTEIMQCTYVLSKNNKIERDKINELVETNPYSTGIKLLMFAFNEEDNYKAMDNYEKAINHIKHIKYYYIEAILTYCKFLKKIESSKFLDWFEKGKQLAQAHRYKYLMHQFNHLMSNEDKNYVETNENRYSDLAQKIKKIRTNMKKPYRGN